MIRARIEFKKPGFLSRVSEKELVQIRNPPTIYAHKSGANMNGWNGVISFEGPQTEYTTLVRRLLNGGYSIVESKVRQPAKFATQ